MKLKNLLFIAASAMLAACSSSSDDIIAPPPPGNGGSNSSVSNPIKDTQLFAGIYNTELENNGLVSISATTRAETSQSILPVAQTANAYFTTRVDSYLNQVNSDNDRINENNDYYPLSEDLGANRVVAMLPENTGTVYTNYPAIKYEKELRKHMQSYVFSTDGSATSTIMRNVPTMEDILSAHYSNRPNIVLDYSRMPADVDKENLHIIWYVVKLLNFGDKQWHVDGILTDKNDIREVMARTPNAKFWEVDELEPMTFDKNNATLRYDDGVSVDISQQEHKDWGEIKTSLHIKSAKDIKIKLPIVDPELAAHPELLEAIAARDYVLPISLESYNNKFFAQIKVNVERNLEGITISVTGLNAVTLKAIEDQYADGLTIEVHTFTSASADNINTVWNQICNARVETEAKVSGHITSAYKTAATDKRVFNEKGEAVYGAINDENAQ